ncbi:ATP-binding cassette domain-containing protein [Labrys wisconsinensis]|uniref:ABC-type sugar transport system ATPase subunit n=1 Tax=Labrys wisconsinensis TaxID=425677 RepID=A0ABU0JB52_9HYPH|nr:ATP-binding cassette domain-containing protein [Labrys wisconsinensis]MDQ0471498.1 ABC-type sugar transport system ATPase subunit [Labrys wisconsinensis]
MITTNTDRPAVLEVRDVSKSFGSVVALERVSLTLHKGEILGLLGDNGAGKSTLIKALSGVHSVDSGEIRLDGKVVNFQSSADARSHGIETVFQDLAVFDNLNVIENIFIGREESYGRFLGPLSFLNRRKMVEQWKRYTEVLEVRIKDPYQPIGLMSGGQRQAVAIARSFAFAGRIVILDEPTAALGLREKRNVRRMIRRLAEQDISVILISHNIQEVLEVCDRATVLRQGRNVGECEAIPELQEHIVSMIVGASAAARHMDHRGPAQ